MPTDDDKQWIANEIAASEGRMSVRIVEAEERMTARIEKTETTLLAEFHKWASPVEMRRRTHAAVQHAIYAEMAALAVRGMKLEAS